MVLGLLVLKWIWWTVGWGGGELEGFHLSSLTGGRVAEVGLNINHIPLGIMSAVGGVPFFSLCLLFTVV